MEKSRLIGGVKRAVELRELQRENQLLKAQVLSDRLERPEAFSEIITTSTATTPTTVITSLVVENPGFGFKVSSILRLKFAF